MTNVAEKKPWLRLSGRRPLPLIRQATATECGLACVAMIAGYHGAGTDLGMLRRQHGGSMKGATLESVATACKSLRLATRAVTCDIWELGKLKLPCILHWRFKHFVVLKSVSRDSIVVHDPAIGVVREPLELAGDAFTGVALEVTTVPGFVKARRPVQLKLSSLVANDADTRNKLVAGLLLALVCEACVLATPFYLQTIIDQVLGKGDQPLLDTLVIAFAVLLLFQVVANVARQITFQFLSQVTVFDLTARVIHRLFSLPLRFFQSRDLGDIQHRVQSLTRVQSFVVQSMPALVLDVLFLVLITGLMCLYSATLTSIAFAALGAWCLWRILILPASLTMSSEIARAEAMVQTHFLESLRAIQSIKAVNGEAVRESAWRNHFATALNARIRAGNLGIIDGVLNQLLFQGVRIAIVFMLAGDALQGEVSIGMMSAFIAYLGMFTARSLGIIDRIVEYRLLEVPLGRLSDIVFSEEEQQSALHNGGSVEEVRLNRVTFTYSQEARPVLSNCSALIPRGAFVAVAGTSGSGKSTLLRLLAGMESPTDGEVVLGGRATSNWEVRALRNSVGVVFQGDVLLKGSVADNIALFDTCADRNRMRLAARQACIDGDIESMPMAYETRIGDLGSAISRGQAQRILLARVFYRRPALLLLDEATSGLDAPLEKRVIAELVKLEATRIVVTHSDLMLAAADHVLWLNKGVLSTHNYCE